jgi:CRISPR/Cas system-associated protein Cas5 (RAMP superfamily)
MLFTDSDKLHENYIQLIVYILCGLLELAIEPVIMYMNLHMENKFLPITISSISRVVTNSFFVSVFGMDLWGFTLSRIIGSIVYFSYIFCLGAFRYKLDFTKFVPTNIRYLICGKEVMNETNILYLREILYQFLKLNLLNLILSRCQNVVLSFVVKSTAEEKSDYSFISQNYGLITRFLLEPIIDAFYNMVNKIKYIEPRNDKLLNEENDMNGKISPEGSMNLNIENNKIQMEEGETKNEKTDSDKNIISIEQNTEVKKEIKKEKEINYDLTIKLLQLFLKIFTYVGVLMIPYYLLIGTEIMGVIYGKRWENNTIDKIGDCFSYYVVVEAVSNLIKNFGNATNDTHQMNLSYVSLIVNAVILYILMYLLSKWDICGLIVSNEFSSVFLINFNLYIIFCGKVNNLLINVMEKSTLFSEINHFIKKCFITKSSIIITTLSLIAGHSAKKVLLVEYPVSIKIWSVIGIGAINVLLLYLSERKSFVRDLNIIRSYQL